MCVMSYTPVAKVVSVIICPHLPHVIQPLTKQHKKVIHILRCHRHPPSEMMNISWQPKLISIEIIVFPMIVIIVIIAIILTVSMSVLPHCDGRHLTGYHHLFTGPATRAKIIIWQRRRKNMFKKLSTPQLFLQQPSAPHQKVDTWTGREGNRSWFMQV